MTPSDRRSVEEWIGSHPDQAIPTRVKLRIWERCGGRCGLTGRKIRPGEPYEFDHTVALVNGGAHAESNIRVVLATAHKIKTAADVGEKAKVARTRAKHLGLHKSPHGMRKHPTKKRTMSGRVVDRISKTIDAVHDETVSDYTEFMLNNKRIG